MYHHRGAINSAAWACWFAGAAAVPLISRNPLYLLVCLLVVLFVHLAWSGRRSTAGAWRLFAYVGSSVAVLSILFNMLTVHVGDREFARLPDGLPIVGGKLTLNALVYGVSSAVAISTLLLAAATFNTAVRHADLLRLMPHRLARLGIAGTIALNFVPQMVNAGRDIYEAQRARGHRYRRPADATALLVPLLATGMERAIDLSEALEVRGFGSPASQPDSGRWRRALGGIAMMLGLIVAVFLVGAGELLAAAVVIGSVIVAIALTGRHITRTHYRPIEWNRRSVLVAASAVGPLTALALHFSGLASLGYEPFPRLGSPEFNLVIGVLIAVPIAPVLLSTDGADR